MIHRAASLTIVAAFAAVAYYLSRFWDLRLWDRDGLLGFESLRPQGGLLARWLRGTDFAVFELLIWVAGIFIGLTALQKAFDLVARQDRAPRDDTKNSQPDS